MRRRALLAASSKPSFNIELPINLYTNKINENAEQIIQYIKSLDVDGDYEIFDLRDILHFNEVLFPMSCCYTDDGTEIGGGTCLYLEDNDTSNYIGWNFYSDGTLILEDD